MNLFESISFIRKKMNISQENMLPDTPHSTYSRIESGKRQIKLTTIKQIAQRFNMNLKELLEFSNVDTKYEQFNILLRECMATPNKELSKKQLLTHFYLPKNLKDMNDLELTFFYSIKGNLAPEWEEIGLLTEEETSFIINRLKQKSFFTQKDYQIAMNIINSITIQQSIELIDLMYPVYLPERRPDTLKRYANHMITNIITASIYELDYKTALKYVELAEKTMDFSADYYLRLNILYHKNVALRFLKSDTLYIERAREIIKIMYAISDPQTAEQFETELNHITEDPSYYQGTRNYPRTTVKE